MAWRSAVIVLLLAGVVRGAAPPVTVEPERLLPSTTQVYLRWDGLRAHDSAYRNSAFGRMLAAEAGTSLRTIWGNLETLVKRGAVADQLLNGLPPDQLRAQADLIDQLLKLPGTIADTGFVVGIEAQPIPSAGQMLLRLAQSTEGRRATEDIVAPHIQLTLILPNAGDRPGVARLLDLLPRQEGYPVRQVKVAGRNCLVSTQKSTLLRWAAWMEGSHLVLVASAGDPVPEIYRIVRAGEGITSHRLYKQLREFRDFRVTTRGFIDGKSLAGALRWLALVDPWTMAALADSGTLDIESLCLWEGFDGEESRSTWEATISSRQRGGTRFLVPKTVSLKSLPPVPADAHRWTVGRAAPEPAYELLLTFLALENKQGTPLTGLFTNGEKALAEAKLEMRREIDAELGVPVGEA
jgi:hypothetical protein